MPLSSCTFPPEDAFPDSLERKLSEGCIRLTLSLTNRTPVLASKSLNEGAISQGSTSAFQRQKRKFDRDTENKGRPHFNHQ